MAVEVEFVGMSSRPPGETLFWDVATGVELPQFQSLSRTANREAVRRPRPRER
jgi:hypothetical protein